MRTGKKTPAWVYTVFGLLFSAIMLFPLYWIINVSLTKPADLVSIPPHLFPADPTLEGYRLAFEKNLHPLLVSLGLATSSVVLCLAISLPAAYGMSKLKAPGTGIIMFGFLLSQMVPGIVVVTALFTLYKNVGLLNTLPGLVLADGTIAVPFATILLQAFMRTLPNELFEAARIDGAGRLRTFWSIAMPLSRNAVVTAGLFAFLFAWGDFLNAKTLTTGNSVVPITLALFRFVGAEATNWNAVMATAVLASVPAALLLVFAQKYVAAGVTAGAVKD